MTDFNHREWTRRALTVAGWTNLEPDPQRNWWRGICPQTLSFQHAPMLAYDHTSALAACLPHAPINITVEGDRVHVFMVGIPTVVKFADCKTPLIAMARALTMALARLDGKEEQLELFEEATQ